MFELNWSRCPLPPRDHQKEGVKFLLRCKTPSGHYGAGNFDEVGAGKTKQVIDTAQILYEGGEIDTVLVLTPSYARGVWADPSPQLGEIAKHGWAGVTNYVQEYAVRTAKALGKGPYGPTAAPTAPLRWIVSNYEFIRVEDRLVKLLAYLATRRFWLVCDESWTIANKNTKTWKSTFQIRKMASRTTILNGTPIAEDPLDLNGQMAMLDEQILGFKFLDRYGRQRWSTSDTRMRERYALMKPNVSFPQIIGWQNLEELSAKVAPYVIRRLTRECFDLPPILDPIMIEAKLDDNEWRLYKQMRDDMVAWLGTDTASVAKQAIVKGLRLAQITSGFLGGLERFAETPEGMLDFDSDQPVPDLPENTPPQEIGRSKLDAMLEWLQHFHPLPNRLLIWSRHRAEIERTARAFDGSAPHLDRKMLLLYGQQSAADRAAAIRALHPDIEPEEPIGVCGIASAGGAGLNFSGCWLEITLSHFFNLRIYLQKRGRIDRPGQMHPIQYVDVVATGPKGQRTIDHHVLASLRGKQDIAEWTASTWRQKLMEE